MSLLNILASQVSRVFSFINQFGSSPVVAGVPIQVYKYVPRQNAEVSKHVLVDLTGGKKFVNDNIAPGPHEWQLEGYIGGFPIEAVGRYEIMPSINTMRDILDTAFQSRQTVTFIDADRKLWPMVAIEDFQQERTPDVQNRLQVRLTIRELNVLSVTAVVQQVASAAAPVVGSTDGATVSGPATAPELLPVDSPALVGDTTTEPFLARLRGGYTVE